ncbi:MAG: hypothetical protein IKU97_00895 [Tidjanibacter sp.]|nr:hypothetical protein [Tidjanibacter sp.]
MKRYVILLWALCASLAVGAQNSGEEVLRSMGEKIAAMGPYRVDFTLEMPGAESGSKGYCVVDGEKFVIAIEDLKQGRNEELLWTVNGTNREISLDEPKPHSRSLFDNPTKAFDFAEELFKVESFDQDDKAVWELILLPNSGVLDGVERIVLKVGRKTNLPTLLGYDLSGMGLFVRIDKFAPCKLSEGVFNLNAADYEGYEIIDFR